MGLVSLCYKLPWAVLVAHSKDYACDAEDPSLIPGSGRSPGEGNGYFSKYSCLENSMDRGACWATKSMR